MNVLSYRRKMVSEGEIRTYAGISFRAVTGNAKLNVVLANQCVRDIMVPRFSFQFLTPARRVQPVHRLGVKSRYRLIIMGR